MKLITRHTDYAVIALCHMAKSAGPVSAAQLCATFGMPRAFIRGILQKLNAAGILASTRGKDGGFVLRRAARQISLLEVMTTFQDAVTADGCRFRKRPCPRQPGCTLRSNLHRIERTLAKGLSAVTIASLAKQQRDQSA